MLRKRNMLTSSFGGTLTAEQSIKDVLVELADYVKVQPPVITCWSATEIDMGMQQVQAASVHKPLHRFDDILSRLYATDRARLERKLRFWLDQWSSVKWDYESGGMDTETMRSWKKRLSDELLRDMCQDMHQIEFKERAHCLEHGCDCSISPWVALDDEANEDTFWFESAGTECRPFSMLNKTTMAGFMRGRSSL